jgi:hypothetical protein
MTVGARSRKNGDQIERSPAADTVILVTPLAMSRR